MLIDPFSERNYQNLMRFLLMNNEREEAIKVYKEMSQMLLSGVGALPGQESRALYREALSTFSAEALSADAIVRELCEQEHVTGAYLCDYDFFRTLYRAHARTMERTGIPSHIAIVTLCALRKDISPDELAKAMDLFEQTLRLSLRRGDVVTRCSASQFIVMLLSADLENSQRVCERFTAAFHHNHPHSPYGSQYEVRAIQAE